MSKALFAHSARPERAIAAQPYPEHIGNVMRGSLANARRASVYLADQRTAFQRAVRTGAAYHDMGKVEDIKQAVLGSDSRNALPGVPHEEAGIAQLVNSDDIWAAALVAAHHRGLFDGKAQRERTKSVERPPVLRNLDSVTITHVDQFLDEWIRLHNSSGCSNGLPQISSPPDPVTLRLSLSCLVDADHSDTTRHQWGSADPVRPRRRWDERLSHLVDAAQAKPKSTERERRRQLFFEGCLGVETTSRVMSCMAPVGSGKTLGVMAHMLKIARQRSLRHIFIVLPFTNIITQAVEEYRAALVLPGEDPEAIVAELHHQADFNSLDARQLAALWRAPIIVTTAVAFFETLAGSKPGRLRKMHELPGSAVFIDEAHAALPEHLWPLAWQWLTNLCDRWSVHAVLGSGSLFRFWEQPGFLKSPTDRVVPELTPSDVLLLLNEKERTRVQPRQELKPLTVSDLATKLSGTPGASVVVLNTVRSAATLAMHLRDSGFDTLHLSTALAPIDRGPIIRDIKRRLKNEPSRSWVLVATSCIEAGLDFSFRRGYREASNVSSLLQLGGRVRRNEEDWDGELISFHAIGPGITKHPSMDESSAILDLLLRDGEFARHDATSLLRMAFERTLHGQFTALRDELYALESGCQYPNVQAKFKVIDADTRIVAVHEPLIKALAAGKKVRFADVVRGSVQIFASRLSGLPCSEVAGMKDIWIWDGSYDPDFLGYLAAQKTVDDFYKFAGAII